MKAKRQQTAQLRFILARLIRDCLRRRWAYRRQNNHEMEYYCDGQIQAWKLMGDMS